MLNRLYLRWLEKHWKRGDYLAISFLLKVFSIRLRKWVVSLLELFCGIDKCKSG